jgi:hypothetical protein
MTTTSRFAHGVQYDFDGPMQLIPRFKGWIGTYYPGTKLSLSEYSIDSGQKSIVDAIAEMDVLGIYGRTSRRHNATRLTLR